MIKHSRITKATRVEPKEYKMPEDEKTVNFKNFYIEYARFHMDDT